MDKQIVFIEKNKAKLIDVESQILKPTEVRVKTIFSTISNGTERANITGDPTIGLNVKPGSEAVFPRVSGYSSSGIVVGQGTDVKSIEIGDRVAMYWTKHRNYNVVDQKNAVKIANDNVSLL